jgi:hypothetical protein
MARVFFRRHRDGAVSHETVVDRQIAGKFGKLFHAATMSQGRKSSTFIRFRGLKAQA